MLNWTEPKKLKENIYTKLKLKSKFKIDRRKYLNSFFDLFLTYNTIHDLKKSFSK